MEGNGEGVKIFDGMSHVASVLSSGIFTALLVLIAYGYSITTGSLRQVSFSGLAGVGPGGVLTIVYMAKFLVMLLSWFGILYSSQDGHAIYHDYEHFSCQTMKKSFNENDSIAYSGF